MNGHKIFPSYAIRYLGVYLDETLNWSFYCGMLSKKLKRANGMLCKARHYIPLEDRKTLYFAIFSSHLTYGSQVWSHITTSFNNKILKLQHRATHIISFADFRAESPPHFSKLKILKLRDHITKQNCLFVHDSLNNISPKCFCTYFKHVGNIHSCNTISSVLDCLLSLAVVQYVVDCILLLINTFPKKSNTNLLTLPKTSLNVK